jgi:hypothetical protein
VESDLQHVSVDVMAIFVAIANRPWVSSIHNQK